MKPESVTRRCPLEPWVLEEGEDQSTIILRARRGQEFPDHEVILGTPSI